MLFSWGFLDIVPSFLHFGKHFVLKSYNILSASAKVPDDKDNVLGLLRAKESQIELKDNFQDSELRSFVEADLLNP